jgi:hypothetical protein
MGLAMYLATLPASRGVVVLTSLWTLNPVWRQERILSRISGLMRSLATRNESTSWAKMRARPASSKTGTGWKEPSLLRPPSVT